MSDSPSSLKPTQAFENDVFALDEPGSLHWTLSIYFTPEDVEKRAGRELDRITFRAMQEGDPASLELARAIDPFFNDVADRARYDGVGELLLAASEPELTVDFELPREIGWVTEGQDFLATLSSLRSGDYPQPPLRATVRRFWLSHANQALSYHVSFSHELRDQRDAAYYYFLSLLQKLAAPRELTKRSEWVQRNTTVFDENTGVGPMDELKLSTGSSSPAAFWTVWKRWFVRDSSALFEGVRKADAAAESSLEERLLKESLFPSPNIPGLSLPRMRSLFFFRDRRFFRRLLPIDPEGKPIARKEFVLDECFAPYRQQIARLRDEKTVLIGQPEPPDGRPFVDGTWLNARPEYRELVECPLGVQIFEARKPGGDTAPIRSIEELEQSAALGEAFQLYEVAPLKSPQEYAIGQNEKHGSFWRAVGALRELGSHTQRTRGLRRKKVPTPVSRGATAGRADCLDYLFLAGFNQNIIDWLNQEPSEILDSTDPIYPKEPHQFEEAFYVRFANHTSLITYAPASRSLEVGARHIGTCPYVFLVHALALQNEMMILDAEELVGKELPGIKGRSESRSGGGPLHDLEDAVSNIRLRLQEDMSAYKAANVFRYDTERDVFDALERLRGIERREAVLASTAVYLDNLVRQAGVRRSRRLNVLLSLLGLTSLISLCFSVADFHGEHPNMLFIEAWDGRVLEFLLSNLGWVLAIFLALLFFSQRLRTLVGRFIEGRAKA